MQIRMTLFLVKLKKLMNRTHYHMNSETFLHSNKVPKYTMANCLLIPHFHISQKINWNSPGDQLAYLWTQSKQKWHQIITYKWINNEINVFFSSKNQQRSPRSVFLIVKKMQNCTFQLRSRALVSRLGLKNADDYCWLRKREIESRIKRCTEWIASQISP